MKRILIKFLALTIISALIGLFYPPAPVANAADLTAKSDTLSTLTASVAANHTFQFTLATGNTFATTETIVITFPAGFDLTGLVNTDALDYDIKTDTGGTPVDEEIVAAGACASLDAIEITSITGQVITFTACASYTATPVTAGIEIQIGLHASLGGPGDTQITNPTAGSQTINLAAGGDTGDIVVVIVADDSVDVTATVPPSLTFTVAGLSLEFGTITNAASRWANASGGSATAVVGTTLEAGTNSTSGYAITINGATLASTGTPGDTITAMATEAVLDTGEVEQFGIRITAAGGSGVVDTVYDNTPADTYALVVAAFPDEIAASATQSIITTYSVYYAANISADTEAHTDYATTLTYVATGNF